jgi:hypothetical protein
MGMALLTALLLCVPSAVGVAPHALFIKAPYKGTLWVPYWSEYTGGCGSVKFANRPMWSGPTGIGSFAFTTSSRACSAKTGTNPVSSYGSVNAQFDLAIPVHFSKSGNHILTANWTLSIQTNQSISPAGACPLPPGVSYVSCSSGSDVMVYGYGFLRDLTNGSQVSPNSPAWSGISNTTSISNYTYCYSGSCSYSYSNYQGWYGGPLTGNDSWQWVMNASGYQSVNASHQYALDVYFWSNAYTSENNFVGGSALVQQNMATQGHGWKLNYLKIV